jgi:hypothetical protein
VHRLKRECRDHFVPVAYDDAQPRSWSSIDRRADLPLKIVFIDRAWTTVRIMAGTPVTNSLIDHVSQTVHGDSGLKLTRTSGRAIRPMPINNVLQPRVSQNYLIATSLDLTIPSALSNTRINGQQKTEG